MNAFVFMSGFVVGAVMAGLFAFWLGVRFGVLVVADQYKKQIQASYPPPVPLYKPRANCNPD